MSLHGDIMNLRPTAPKHWIVKLFIDAHTIGHAQARHAAAELALGADAQTERLTLLLKSANDNAERFEREWYLRGDKIEALETALTMLYSEAADYIRLNNLGGMDNQCMQLARAALGLPAP